MEITTATRLNSTFRDPYHYVRTSSQDTDAIHAYVRDAVGEFGSPGERKVRLLNCSCCRPYLRPPAINFAALTPGGHPLSLFRHHHQRQGVLLYQPYGARCLSGAGRCVAAPKARSRTSSLWARSSSTRERALTFLYLSSSLAAWQDVVGVNPSGLARSR